MPEPWFTEADKERRATGHGPTDAPFHTKPPLAAARLRAMAHAGRVPFRYVVADCLSGNRPDCLDAVEACVGVTAVVAIPAETHGWLQAPRPLDKPSLYTGEVRSQRVGVGPEPAPGTVAAVAAPLPASQGYRRTGSEGTKGPIESAFARPRVTLCQAGLPDRPVWLLSKRPGGANPVSADSLSHAPVRPPWRTLVWLSGVRWAIEPCCAEGQTE